MQLQNSAVLQLHHVSNQKLTFRGMNDKKKEK